MSALTIYIYATTTNPSSLFMSNDGTTWTASDDFLTTVAALDSVQWQFNLEKDSITNNITGISNITPATFFQAGKHPKSNNNWTGTIKTGNPAKGLLSYSVSYSVSGVNGTQTQDPKLQMNT